MNQTEIAAALALAMPVLMTVARKWGDTLPADAGATDNAVMATVALVLGYMFAVGQTGQPLAPQTWALTAGYFAAGYTPHAGLDLATKNTGGNPKIPTSIAANAASNSDDGATTPAYAAAHGPGTVLPQGRPLPMADLAEPPAPVEPPPFDPSINHDFEAIIGGGGGV